MASGIASPPGQPEGPQKQPPEPPPTRYEAFIEERLRRTRRQVKGVDITSGVMTLAAGTLAYLLAAAVVDHWLIAGGLDFWGRILLLLGLVGAGGTYFCFRLLPPLVHRINPVFAAQTIEQSRPTLKNSLINFLLMRNHRQEVAPVVYQALEHRAAADLSGVRIETAVDRARIVRLGSVLLAIVAVFALYVLLSPKSPLLSVERIIWPWSNVPAPTRVTIDEVHPGDAIAFHGDILTVTAEVHGLHADEPVTLYYSTADDENVDQAITLAPIGDGDRYQCTLPPGNVGLQQDVRYHLTAGDCRTPLFKIEVQVAPAILIDKVDYHYPDYTGLKNRSVAGQGDLHAIEGTRVTINATANHDIQRAEIDLDCNGRRSLKMDTAGRTATGEFTLRLDPDDPTKPEHDSYQLLFTDNRGRTNTRPIRYRVDVIRDLPPEVKILSPEQEEVQVPVDGRLSIAVRAEDPDFALRQVPLRAQHEGRELPIPPLLSKVSPETAFPGEFRATCVFQPARLGLKPGDRVMYWAEAEDNKEPTANRSETDRRVMTIVAPDGAGQQGPQPHRAVRNGQPHHPDDNAVPPERQPKQGPAENVKQLEGAKNGPQADDKHQSDKQDGQQDKPQNNNDQQQRGGQESDGSQSGQDASGQRQDQTNDQASGQPNEPVPSDGTNDADAMAKIDKERQKEQPDKQPSDNQPQQSGQQQGGQQQSGQQQSGQQQSGQQQGGQQQSGQQQSGQQQSGQQSGGQQQSGQQPGGQQQGGQQQSGQQQSGQQQGGQQQGGQQQSGQQQSGQQQSGQQQGGQQQGGQQQGGQQQGGQQSGGQQQSGQQPGGQQQSGQQSGGQQQGGQQQSGQQPGGQQQSGQQPGGQQQSGQQQGGQQQSGQQPGGQQQSGQQPGGQQLGGQQQGGQQPGGSPQQTAQPQGGQPQQGGQPSQDGSSQTQSGGQRPDGQPSPDSNSQSSNSSRSTGGTPKAGAKTPGGDKQGADQQHASGDKPQGDKPDGQPHNAGEADPQQKAGAGQGTDKTGSTAAQNDNTRHDKQPGDSGSNHQESAEAAKSPSNSTKQSDSKGETGGDRSGGGDAGGGQKTAKPGTGSAGSNTPSDEGGSKSDQQGQGETGPRAGNQVKSDHKTGSSTTQPGGTAAGQGQSQTGNQSPGKNDQTQPSNSPGGTDSQGDASGGNQAGNQDSTTPGAGGMGNPTTGGVPGNRSGTPATVAKKEPGGDDPNQEYARKQTDLALEYLRDRMAKDKPELLDKLGWSRQDAERFLKRWEQWKQAAGQQGPEGQAAKKSLDEAIKSLGLRPHGTVLRGGQTKHDQLDNLRDAGRSDPPGDWAEQVHEYTRGVATGGR